MKKIYKYTLNIEDRQGLEMPTGAKILSAKNQGDNICLWALVDTEEKMTMTYEIEIFSTGNPVYENDKTFREFIDTCVMPNGLVWHLFKRIA